MPQYQPFSSASWTTQGPSPQPFDLSFLGQGGTTIQPNPNPFGYSQSWHPPAGSSQRTGQYNRGRQQGPQPLPLITQLGQAGFYDAARIQGAADRQFGRVNTEIQGFRDFLGRNVNEFGRLAEEQAGVLRGEADRVEQGAGADLTSFDKFRDKTLKETRAGVNQSMSEMHKAISGFQQSVDDYRKTGYQDASVAAAGIRESFQQGMNMATKGIGPDGRPMTAAEQMAVQSQIVEQSTRAVASAVMPHLQRVSENLLQAGGQLAQLRTAAGGMRMQGEALMSQTAATFSGQRVQLSAQADHMREVATNLRTVAAGLKSAAHLTSVGFEMQGRNTIAALVQSNPESVVSLMPILSAIFAAGSAPGAGRIRGFSFSEMNPAFQAARRA